MESFVTEELIFMTRAGSHMYGTNVPESDIDKRGVCVPPKKILLGFARNFDQQQFPNEDTVVYSLHKFMRLCADNNPNILELLYAPEEAIETITPTWEKLIEHRDKFLSAKSYHTFTGYAHSQLARIKGHRKWLRNPPTKAPTRQEYGLEEKPSGLRELAKGTDLTQVSPEALLILEKEKKFKANLRNWNDYQKWLRERNPARAKLEKQFGYDTKHALHLVRLLRMGKEILTTGKVIVRRPDADELLAIRKGAYSYDGLMELVDPLFDEIKQVYENKTYVVPFSVNKQALSDLCVDLLEFHWSKNELS